MQKRYKEALGPARIAIQQPPNYPPAYANLGAVLGKLGRHVEALQYIDYALALDPTYDQARYNRAVLLKAVKEQKGQNNRAVSPSVRLRTDGS